MKSMFKNMIFIFVLLLVVIPTNCFANQIYVKSMSGKTITIEVESSDTIEAVKVKIHEGFMEEGNKEFLPESQSLDFNGINLKDGRTLADYNIEAGHTIYVTLKKTHFNIIYKLSNLISTNSEILEKGKDFEISLVAVSNYKLPDSISVSINGIISDKYTYDKETGKLFISSDDITGDIEINASGVEIEENPKTGDDVTLSIVIGALSLLGSISIGIYLKSKIRA